MPSVLGFASTFKLPRLPKIVGRILISPILLISLVLMLLSVLLRAEFRTLCTPMAKRAAYKS
jgi:hypothetical protein